MEIIIVATAAFFAAGLTLFSGFGLGTLLMPVIAMFVPADVAIGVTAIVHCANNLFKLGLLGKQANFDVVLKFGIPAVLAAFCGAILLGWLTTFPALFEYSLFGSVKEITLIKLIIGMVIIAFVAVELSPVFSSIKLDKEFLPAGGIISGFFGGLSGHQGAFRSMFLLKAGLSKEQFVATGVVLAVMVDLSRMSIYGLDALFTHKNIDWSIVIAATLSAFVGSFFGSRLVKKITIHSIQMIVSCLLVVISLGMVTGIF
jgi:uncharacterized membrane protein YfcA